MGACAGEIEIAAQAIHGQGGTSFTGSTVYIKMLTELAMVLALKEVGNAVYMGGAAGAVRAVLILEQVRAHWV